MRRLSSLVVALWLVTVVVLSFYGNSQSLDQDESFSVWIARPGWEHIKFYIRDDPHAPLYYGLLSFWIRLGGESELWVRTLPATIFLGGLTAVWMLGRRVFSPRQMRWIMVGLATSPWLLCTAVTGRMYGLLEAESAIAIIAYLGLTSGRLSSRLGMMSLFAANLAGVFTHYYYFVLMGAIGLIALFFGRRDRLLAVMASIIGPAAIFAMLWGPVFRLQLASGRFVTADEIPPAIQVHNQIIRGLREVIVTYYGRRGLVLIVPVLILISLTKRRRHRYRWITVDELKSRWRWTIKSKAMLRASALIWLLCLLLPMLSLIKVGELKSAPLIALTIFPLILMMVMTMERAGDARLRSLVALGLLLITLANELKARYLIIRDPRIDRAWIQRVLNDSRPGDSIICSGGTYFPIVDYYVRNDPAGRGINLFVFPAELAEHPGWYFQPLALKQLPAMVDEARALGKKVCRTAGDREGGKVWIFSVQRSDAETARILTDALPANMAEVERIAVSGNFGRFDRIQLFGLRADGVGQGVSAPAQSRRRGREATGGHPVTAGKRSFGSRWRLRCPSIGRQNVLGASDRGPARSKKTLAGMCRRGLKNDPAEESDSL